MGIRTKLKSKLSRRQSLLGLALGLGRLFTRPVRKRPAAQEKKRPIVWIGHI